MKDPFGETGLRKAYQYFLILRILFWVFLNDLQVLFLPQSDTIGPFSFPQTVVLVAADLLFFIGLALPQVRERLGRHFYPLFNLCTVLILFLAQFWWEAGNLSFGEVPHNPLISPFSSCFS